MKLSELFANSGLGVMSTAAADGSVNSAIYARPHVIDEMTLVWGMTDKRSYRNICENRYAAYLFKVNDSGFRGVRLALELIRSEKSGEMLETIKHNADNLVGPGTGAAVTHAVWFRVIEVRSLI